MAGNKAHDNKKPAKTCGAKTRDGKKCKRPAGWGTDHPGSGRCKLHGGASTGPKTQAGKEKVKQNAVKHGAYVERLLNLMEKAVYDDLYEKTIEKHGLDRGDPMQMATLHRACITYIKLIRVDLWELERQYQPIHVVENPNNPDEPIFKPQNIYGPNGEIVGDKVMQVVELRANKDFMRWEAHFQRYMQLLGVDRGTKIKVEGNMPAASHAADAIGWLWGNKSID
ncbi:HGGxSTG domain-containing protein [Bacillus cereus group sp. MYBK12-2]|uniref:HGGxSTG domain-containing protein n=1 Tax=Bacillus cereus group sp. MYBK12-2 TaxID=3450689 RepID=UPI003303DE61|nr:hypothetical protein [Bacillus pacificus]HDR7653562.1 hypothetical protein [Bacillus pacificus]